MKRVAAMFLSLILIIGLTACRNPDKKDEAPSQKDEAAQTDTSRDSKTIPSSEVDNTLLLQVGKQKFTITMYDNASAKALLERLPLTLNMSEMNGNEKYYYLPKTLPSSDQNIETINTGDFMLYGSDCLVIFYKSFPTSYQYTPLGKISGTRQLAEALGSSDVQVTLRAR